MQIQFKKGNLSEKKGGKSLHKARTRHATEVQKGGRRAKGPENEPGLFKPEHLKKRERGESSQGKGKQTLIGVLKINHFISSCKT